MSQHQPDQSRDRKALCQKVETSAVAQFPATQSLVIFLSRGRVAQHKRRQDSARVRGTLDVARMNSKKGVDGKGEELKDWDTSHQFQSNQ